MAELFVRLGNRASRKVAVVVRTFGIGAGVDREHAHERVQFGIVKHRRPFPDFSQEFAENVYRLGQDRTGGVG